MAMFNSFLYINLSRLVEEIVSKLTNVNVDILREDKMATFR